MAADEARIFEDHYMTCARCAGIVENTETFIVAMRRAAERLRHRHAGERTVSQSITAWAPTSSSRPTVRRHRRA